VAERFDRLEEKLDRLRQERKLQRDPDRLLTREEAAERLQVSIRTLDTLRAAGKLRAVKVKRRVRFHPDALDAYIRRAAEGGRR
jgi:excisionase family DNA binding protein